ncbi:MAG: transcription antitermination factor NusB [Deltaproteobacteria bacterium]|nr:transcription antitermination factor NusB [Deltaproteobacteria bacterium]
MGSRRHSREYALQMLYQQDLSGDPLPHVFEHYWRRQAEEDAETREFAETLVRGVADQKEEIDVFIAKYSTHWKLNRMAAVDKNILRMAVFELKNCKDIPLRVTLNEAIEIAKKFGSEESGSFINGVLDKIAKEIKKEM